MNTRKDEAVLANANPYRVEIHRVKFRTYLWNIQVYDKVHFGMGSYRDARTALKTAIREGVR